MTYRASLEDGLPILVAHFTEPLDPVADVSAMLNDLAALSHGDSGRCAVVTDVSTLRLTPHSISQLLYEAILRPHSRHRLLSLHKGLPVFAVGRGSLLEPAVRAAAQDQYHNLTVTLYGTLADAIAAARTSINGAVPLKNIANR